MSQIHNTFDFLMLAITLEVHYDHGVAPPKINQLLLSHFLWVKNELVDMEYMSYISASSPPDL